MLKLMRPSTPAASGWIIKKIAALSHGRAIHRPIKRVEAINQSCRAFTYGTGVFGRCGLAAGEAVLVPDADGAVRLSGRGRAALVSVPGAVR